MLVTTTARQTNLAKVTRLYPLNGLMHRLSGSLVEVALNHTLIFSGSPDELAALEDVVRDGFFDGGVFAGLAGPDAHQAVPVIGCDDGDGVDVLVFEELAIVDVGVDVLIAFGEVLLAPVQHSGINVAEGDDADTRHASIGVDMALAHAIEADDGNADVVIGASDA